ncbi:tRNA-splicing endonuclease subunit [Podila verticillata]|nr:tRNA-splicing endonuclease subunit [Podila verticillata]
MCDSNKNQTMKPMENTQDLIDAATAAAEAGALGFAAPSSANASTSTSQQETGATRKPKVYISGSAALVWDVEDVSLLRQAHRITGSLAGSLPRSPLQNIFQGLPLRLSPEEVFALWDSGLVDLVDDSRAYREPTADEKADLTTGATTTTSADQGKVSKNNAKSNFEYITLHTLSSYLPWFTSGAKDNTPQNSTSSSPLVESKSLPEHGQPHFWRYPSTPQDWRRSIIFKHLWADQQYFLAPGMKFGGDYLLYKKDPLVCHSSLIASIRDIDEPLSLTDLANFARLASSVQKRHLLCSVIQQEPKPTKNTSGNNTRDQSKAATNNSVVIFAVEWAGF